MRKVVIAVLAAFACLAAGCNSTPRVLTDDLEDLKKRVKVLEGTVAAHDARLKSAKRNPTTTTIVLSKNPSGVCDTAKVLDYRVGNQHQRHVRWNIEDECNLVGARIELRFVANRQGQYPFPTANLRSRPNNRFIQDRISRDADVEPGVFSYAIWLVPASGDPRPLLDPELEVEPPPETLPAGTPGAPPAKKQ
ncbi:MAG: hypothetical protein K2Y23_14160 [Cyanobacteria bacterium]|nr:hypothetical protein [Cyanobacteriota bacterium]